MGGGSPWIFRFLLDILNHFSSVVNKLGQLCLYFFHLFLCGDRNSHLAPSECIQCHREAETRLSVTLCTHFLTFCKSLDLSQAEVLAPVKSELAHALTVTVRSFYFQHAEARRHRQIWDFSSLFVTGSIAEPCLKVALLIQFVPLFEELPSRVFAVVAVQVKILGKDQPWNQEDQ